VDILPHTDEMSDTTTKKAKLKFEIENLREKLRKLKLVDLYKRKVILTARRARVKYYFEKYPLW
jgi:adenine-specific DNA methylase